MTDWSDWPIGERRQHAPEARPVRAARRRPQRSTWVLGIAAFACGALLSAVAFSAGWRHQAQHTSSSDAALAAATARAQHLNASLRAARAKTARLEAQLATAQQARKQAEASARAVSKEAAALASGLVQAGRRADSVSAGAGSVGTSVDRIASELKTLTTYLTTTPAGQLDPGYISTQTAYLTRQLDQLKAARSDLAAAIGDFEASVQALGDRAAKLSGSN